MDSNEKETGAITVAVNYYGTVRTVFNVSRGSFMPAPNVDSAVIRIDPHPEPKLDEENEKFFFRIVRSGFSQRRKTAANALSSMAGIPKDKIYATLEEMGLSRSARLEELDMDELIRFAVELKKKNDAVE